MANIINMSQITKFKTAFLSYFIYFKTAFLSQITLFESRMV